VIVNNGRLYMKETESALQKNGILTGVFGIPVFLPFKFRLEFGGLFYALGNDCAAADP